METGCGGDCIWSAAGGATSARADIAFQYNPITDPIVSATFSVDFAAMNAHRTVSGYETNFVQLVDCNAGGGLPDHDLSNDLFGTAAWPDTPQVDMGVLETGWISADIDSGFYPALAGGKVGLRALFTDTVDAMFALDCLILSIELEGEEFVHAYYGWPVGNENNGFGIDLADGGDLPAPFPGVLEPTGTGFDEEISSKAIYAVPEPAGIPLLGLGAVFGLCRRKK